MIVRSGVPAILLLALVSVSCGGLEKVTRSISGGRDPFEKPDPYGGIPPQLRQGGGLGQARTAVAGVDPAVTQRNRGRGGATLLTPEEDIVWTDPDDPDADLPWGVEDRVRVSSGDSWEASYSLAKKKSLREGKPLLIWFTNSDPSKSPVCRTLSGELFSKPEFDIWAKQNVIRLRLDFNVKDDGSGEDMMDARARKLDYLEKLEKRLKARGKPHVLVMAPDGTTISRHRGYRTDSGEYFWGQLRHSVVLAKSHHEEWVEKKKSKGYRSWNSRNESLPILAKLLRYREGELLLVEPDGKRFLTKESNLSEADRLWIAGQKASRE